MILLIDHYDSFTYNIYQAVAAMGIEVEVVRYGVLTLDEIKAKNPEAIILSPGPGHPLELPKSIELIQQLHRSLPILGICLGQQLIGAAFGGKVVQAPFIRHGKVSQVSHNQQGLFRSMPLPLPVMRYHSLVLEKESLAGCLEVQSRALDDDTIMAVKHRDYPVFGIQFHPESIGTPDGVELMKEFVAQVRQKATSNR
ncbi:aminodeoxychorismate/anthranilate synthase component II [Microbacterium sp. APC 3898]|jgi:anthranilate synthase/aminodeoxychorismate synthase-like glutamine amidotransferase|uniref:Aminodeoxychorismate/anthranilate synthase component II n=1 Tax=Planococcus notacanthi TaxID=3035188 RepID=A0ABT7ZLC6_9BACL|nr:MULTISPECIES: aminodeoxychorismate/anthranilate synthase component II [Terrabacteria group]MDN3427970.1 aminodeoxychorismate/anthranilate synthase component II [Planococcus sp. APC 4016]MDN3498495.1 aminodeoxychorismate/anthranilate synthase component II [Microbacterium sp. APC 3898]